MNSQQHVIPLAKCAVDSDAASAISAKTVTTANLYIYKGYRHELSTQQLLIGSL